MTIRRAEWIWLFLFFAIGCTGGRAAPEPPQSLGAGTREIRAGNELYRKGCHSLALKRFFAAHRRFSAADHIPGVAMSLNNIGTVYRGLNRPESAVQFFAEAGRLYDALGDAPQAAQALSNQSAALIDAYRLEEATRLLDRAEALYSPMPPPAFILKNRGILLMHRQQYGKAEIFLKNALDRADPADPLQGAAIRFALGTLMVRTGQDRAAAGFFQAALETDRRAGFHKGMADDLAALAEVRARLGNPAAATAAYKRSVKIYALMQNRARVDSVMAALTRIAEKEGMDITLTRHFVQTWLDDQSGWNPCRK